MNLQQQAKRLETQLTDIQEQIWQIRNLFNQLEGMIASLGQYSFETGQQHHEEHPPASDM